MGKVTQQAGVRLEGQLCRPGLSPEQGHRDVDWSIVDLLQRGEGWAPRRDV